MQSSYWPEEIANDHGRGSTPPTAGASSTTRRRSHSSSSGPGIRRRAAGASSTTRRKRSHSSSGSSGIRRGVRSGRGRRRRRDENIDPDGNLFAEAFRDVPFPSELTGELAQRSEECIQAAERERAEEAQKRRERRNRIGDAVSDSGDALFIIRPGDAEVQCSECKASTCSSSFSSSRRSWSTNC